jgi:hypothetical protein
VRLDLIRRGAAVRRTILHAQDRVGIDY